MGINEVDVDVFVKYLIFVIFLGVWIYAPNASAFQKRCPVCHETFDEEVHVCPNDGTDLQLLGEKVEVVPRNGGTESTPSEGNSKENALDSNSEANEGKAGKAKSKYTRQDRGGRRKRVAKKDEDDVVQEERTDRQRRLHDARTAGAAPKPKEPSSNGWARRNAKLRNIYFSRKAEYLSTREEESTSVELPAPEVKRQEGLWEQTAPFMSIGARLSWIGEAKRIGTTFGAEIDLNLLRTSIRMGLSSFIGVRHVSRNELLFLESVSIGIQRPWRFSPFIVGRIGIGAIVSQRFGADITNLVRAIGADVGVDCRLNNAFVVTPSIGFIHYGILDAGWNSVSLKVSLGF